MWPYLARANRAECISLSPAATILIIDLIHVQYSCTAQEMNPGDRR